MIVKDSFIEKYDKIREQNKQKSPYNPMEAELRFSISAVIDILQEMKEEIERLAYELTVLTKELK